MANPVPIAASVKVTSNRFLIPLVAASISPVGCGRSRVKKFIKPLAAMLPGTIGMQPTRERIDP